LNNSNYWRVSVAVSNIRSKRMSIGKVVTTENNEISQDGAFVRQTNRFDTPFGNEPSND
jgi:hypothetical protein